MEFMKNGKRIDNRLPKELRPIKFEVGALQRADGSCYVEHGGNKIMAAVYGPRAVHPRHLQQANRAIIRYRYNMASFSVEERRRPGPDRRSVEISKVSRQAIDPVIIKEFYPRSTIDIFVEILQADAGTRSAGINAASVALADAGVPMRGLISSCAVGKVDDTVVLDLVKEEDNDGQADMPVAMDVRTGEVTLLQMDGHLTLDEFEQALELGKIGCASIADMQREALIQKYRGEEDE
jgi:exosome complex component RRP41